MIDDTQTSIVGVYWREQYLILKAENERLTPSGTASAHGQPTSASAETEVLYGPRQQIQRLPNVAQQCPLCPDIFTGSYSEHLDSPRHQIRPEPDDLSHFHA